MAADGRSPVDGSLALTLDSPTFTRAGFLWIAPDDGPPVAGAGMAGRGPDKYRILAHRRRQAQMKARRVLEGNG